MTLYSVPMNRLSGLPPFVMVVALPGSATTDHLADPGLLAALVATFLCAREPLLPEAVASRPGDVVRDGELLNAYYWRATTSDVAGATGATS